MLNNNYVGILVLLILCSFLFLALKFWSKHIWSKKDHPIMTSFLLRNNKMRITILLLLLCFLFYFDFLRDYIFKNLTYRMNYIDLIENGGSPDKYLDPTDSFMVKILQGLSSYEIYYLKFIFTFLLTGIYFILCQLILKLTYIKFYTLPFSSLLYGLGTFFMAFVFSFYFFTFPYEIKNNFYLISMEIGHFLQSSLPTLLLILSFKIYLSSQNNNQLE